MFLNKACWHLSNRTQSAEAVFNSLNPAKHIFQAETDEAEKM